MIKTRSLTPAFHKQNPSIKEALEDKKRGYGIVTITVNNLIFGIPVRTRLNHPHGIVLDTIIKKNVICKRGLDFTKALLISNPSEQLGTTFILADKQLEKLHKDAYVIKNKFEKYVNRYVKAVQNGNTYTLQGGAYMYTTLVNYHNELGI